MNVVYLIKQINSYLHVHNNLCEQIKIGIQSKNNQINAEGLYKKNEQQFYSLLRCKHELDRFLGGSAIPLSLEEQTYFETLLEYTKSLLRVIRVFPKLTYFFWQKSLGNYREQFYQNTFMLDWNRYQSCNLHAVKMFRRVKQFN